VPLFASVLALERGNADCMPWDDYHRLAACLGVDMLVAVNAACPDRTAATELMKFEVPCAATARDRVDVVKHCATLATGAKYCPDCGDSSQWPFALPCAVADTAVRLNAVQVMQWLVEQPGVHLWPDYLVVAACSRSVEVLRILLEHVPANARDNELLVIAAVRDDAVLSVVAGTTDLARPEFLEAALTGGSVAAVRRIQTALGIDDATLRHDYLVDADLTARACTSSADMCRHVLDIARPPDIVVADIAFAACARSCSAVLRVALEHRRDRGMPPPTLGCALIAVARFNNGDADAVESIHLLLAHGCPCTEQEVLQNCFTQRRRDLLAQMLRGRLSPPVTTT